MRLADRREKQTLLEEKRYMQDPGRQRKLSRRNTFYEGAFHKELEE